MKGKLIFLEVKHMILKILQAAIQVKDISLQVLARVSLYRCNNHQIQILEFTKIKADNLEDQVLVKRNKNKACIKVLQAVVVSQNITSNLRDSIELVKI